MNTKKDDPRPIEPIEGKESGLETTGTLGRTSSGMKRKTGKKQVTLHQIITDAKKTPLWKKLERSGDERILFLIFLKEEIEKLEDKLLVEYENRFRKLEEKLGTHVKEHDDRIRNEEIVDQMIVENRVIPGAEGNC